MRVVVALVGSLALFGCTLISLDQLQDGGGGAPSDGGNGNGAAGTGADGAGASDGAGPAGGGGNTTSSQGGGVPGTYADCLLDDQPSIYFRMNEAGAEPNQSISIGDTGGDRGCARTAGVGASGAGWGYHEVEELKSGGAHAVAMLPGEVMTLAENWVRRAA